MHPCLTGAAPPASLVQKPIKSPTRPETINPSVFGPFLPPSIPKQAHNQKTGATACEIYCKPIKDQTGIKILNQLKEVFKRRDSFEGGRTFLCEESTTCTLSRACDRPRAALTNVPFAAGVWGRVRRWLRPPPPSATAPAAGAPTPLLTEGANNLIFSQINYSGWETCHRLALSAPEKRSAKSEF